MKKEVRTCDCPMCLDCRAAGAKAVEQSKRNARFPSALRATVWRDKKEELIFRIVPLSFQSFRNIILGE